MNWTFTDVTSFLKEHHFHLNYVKGSHHFYIGFAGGQSRQALVPFHGRKVIKPKTMSSIIRQSGIAREEWLG